MPFYMFKPSDWRPSWKYAILFSAWKDIKVKSEKTCIDDLAPNS